MATLQKTEEIFREFVAGDITDFYKYFYRDLLLYANSCLGSRLSLMAEDCVQQAVEKAYCRRQDFVSSAQWKAFLLTCIRNHAISLFRKTSASDHYTEYVGRLEELHEDILMDYIQHETLSRLYRAIDTLPADMRELLEMSFEEGLKNHEIAARLGVAEITVKKRKARLIMRLREILDDSEVALLLMLLMSRVVESR